MLSHSDNFAFWDISDFLIKVRLNELSTLYMKNFLRYSLLLILCSNSYSQIPPAPAIVLNTDKVVGNALSDGSSYTEELVISNPGTAILSDITVGITGIDSNQFTVSGVPASINAQGSSSFFVHFTPSLNGPKSALLTITGTDADAVVIPVRGLGTAGYGGENEPSLQWVLDTQLGIGVVDTGDIDPDTSDLIIADGISYNDIIGDEIAAQRFEWSQAGPVSITPLGTYGPTNTDIAFTCGWYTSGDPSSTNELFQVSNTPPTNSQGLNPPVIGDTEFEPGSGEFGFYITWPFFDYRQVFSEDAFNTIDLTVPHKVRVYELPGEPDSYILVFELIETAYDYNDVVFIARNIKPYNVPAPSDVWLDAECATLGSGWSVVTDADVSGGQYVSATSGANFYSNAPTNPESYVSFDFTANAGKYIMYGLMDTPSDNSDSFWVRANGGPWIKWNNLLREGGFAWRRLYDSDSNDLAVSFDLLEGSNTLDIAIRENGTALDKIYLTLAGSIPVGFGQQAMNCTISDTQPFADAGEDVSLLLPDNSVVLNGIGGDMDGGTVSYEWTQTSGPNAAVVNGTNGADLTVDNLIEGVYSFNLSVTDDEGNSVSDEVSVSVVDTVSSDVWLEAECAEVVGSGWSLVPDGNVSGGQYVSATSATPTSTSSAPIG